MILINFNEHSYKNLEQKTMFGVLFKQKNKTAEKAGHLYEVAILNTRDSIFYEEYGVPDTFDGRFDLLLLHVFIQLNRIMGAEDYDDVSQKLFDITFRDMDQTLREMGIGDMGITKHLKRMMKAFNGRMHAYQDGIEGKQDMKQVLKRNLYGTLENIEESKIDKMIEFIERNVEDKDVNHFQNKAVG